VELEFADSGIVFGTKVHFAIPRFANVPASTRGAPRCASMLLLHLSLAMTLLLVLEWESASTLLVTAFELVLYPASGFSNLLVHSLAACQAAWFFVLESYRMCCW
jgi:hypothetical protein